MQGKRDFKSRLNNKKLNIDEELKNLSGDKKDQFNRLKSDVNKYKGKSKSELMRELETMVANGKKDGSVNNEMMEQFKNRVAPMLEPEQRKNMESMIEMLKGKQG